MSKKTDKSIANTLECSEMLLPHMPFLLQDLWALGCSIDQILGTISTLDLPPDSTKILDLGCGKGAVIVQIAEKYGFHVTGVDAMEGFLSEARMKADEFGVSGRCEFISMDIMDYVKKERGYDVVLLAALGGIFGSFADTVKRMRSQVRAGGYLLIDDGYLRQKNNILRKGYSHYRDYDSTIKELTSFDDKIVAEINTSQITQKINRDYLKYIMKKAKVLLSLHPELAKELGEYISIQKEECDIIDEDLEGVLWVIRKGKG